MLIDPPIRSSRLVLRPLTGDDIGERYLSWLTDREIIRYLETRFSDQSVDGIRKYIATLNNSEDTLFLGMFVAEAGLHIGNIKLGPINSHHDRADIGIVVGDRDHWGKGFATEAIEALTAYAFDTLGLHKISAGVYNGNEGSTRAFLKAGYTEEGRLKDHWRCGDEWQDGIVLGRVRGD